MNGKDLERMKQVEMADAVQSVFMRISVIAYFETLAEMTGDSSFAAAFRRVLSFTAVDAKGEYAPSEGISVDPHLTVGELLYAAEQLFRDSDMYEPSGSEDSARLLVEDLLIKPMSAVRGMTNREKTH